MQIFRWVPSIMMKSDKYQTKYNYETTEHPQTSTCFYSRKKFHYLPFICFHFIFLLCIQPLFVFTKALVWICKYFNLAWLFYILIQTHSQDRILSYFQSWRYALLVPIISFDQNIKNNISWYCKSFLTLSG